MQWHMTTYHILQMFHQLATMVMCVHALLKQMCYNMVHYTGPIQWTNNTGELGGKGWFVVRSSTTGAIKLAMAGT